MVRVGLAVGFFDGATPDLPECMKDDEAVAADVTAALQALRTGTPEEVKAALVLLSSACQVRPPAKQNSLAGPG